MKSFYIPLLICFAMSICLTSQTTAQDSVARDSYATPLFRGNISELGREDSIIQVIMQSHEEARCTMEEIYAAFLSLKENDLYDSFAEGWNEHEDFPLWLGPCKGDDDIDDLAFQQEIEERLLTLKDWLEHHEIIYKVRVGPLSYCELSHSTAYTSQLSRKKTINLCPYWFRCRSKQRAATIIHELVHKMGFGHPEGTVTPKQAIVLARLKPAKARKSPENYEGLAESFFCKIYLP